MLDASRSEDFEKKLAEQLASTISGSVEPEVKKPDLPSVADLQRDIAASSAEVDEAAAKENVALPPVTTLSL